MPEKHEMEYVPVECEARANRSRGLRIILEQLLLRLLRNSCICPFCLRVLETEAQEKVIEFLFVRNRSVLVATVHAGGCIYVISPGSTKAKCAFLVASTTKLAKQRIVNTKFWDDSYITRLTPTEKLLFLYLITNPLTNISGVYELPLKRVAFDTGFSSATAPSGEAIVGLVDGLLPVKREVIAVLCHHDLGD